ncbi:MAG: polyamine ABC transporter ATP-binding protein [Lachnospiraceae bacterium]|jgi:spermidine/putrescine transport system ATP-binding protein|nr:polyamine ABC transporter ATP-binding protein [Lachnospiraceae bacterium]
MSQTIVELKKVNKYFDGTPVVKDLSLDIYEGEFLSLLGPSGCGKTTTLRMSAGFEIQTSGTITVEGEPVEDKEPFERNVNTVFQSYALFPHMTVYDNIAYGLKMKKVPKAEISKRVFDALAMVRLAGFDKRYPAQLSGGQKQRVAIARAIINRPRVLLLDEPLGALDMKLRKQMQIELKNLQKMIGITFVYVTHDQEEALTMSDRIAVMNVGVLEQIGTPSEIYEKPKTRFVADFIGETNLFEAVASSKAEDGVVSLHTEVGAVLCIDEAFSPTELVNISVRPEKILVSESPVPGFALPGTVTENIYIGTVVKSLITLPNGQVIRLSTTAGQAPPPVGATMNVHWQPEDAVVMHTPANSIYTYIKDLDFTEYLGKG